MPIGDVTNNMRVFWSTVTFSAVFGIAAFWGLFLMIKEDPRSLKNRAVRLLLTFLVLGITAIYAILSASSIIATHVLNPFGLLDPLGLYLQHFFVGTIANEQNVTYRMALGGALSHLPILFLFVFLAIRFIYKPSPLMGPHQFRNRFGIPLSLAAGIALAVQAFYNPACGLYF